MDIRVAGAQLPVTKDVGANVDYLQGENEIAIVVGDVTGHGMQGAMNAVMVDSVLRSLARRGIELSPVNLMSELNNDLTPQLESGMNVTMVIGLINAMTQTLTLANAGHHAHPQLLRNGQLTPLLAKGMPLGMMVGISYREIEFQLQSGDVLVFMTDGIIEAKDSEGTEYQETGRLAQVLGNFTPETSAEAMVSALIDDATTFGADMTAEEEDDITVVVAKVL